MLLIEVRVRVSALRADGESKDLRLPSVGCKLRRLRCVESIWAFQVPSLLEAAQQLCTTFPECGD